MVGALKHSSGNYTSATLVLAAVMALGAAFACVVLPLISPDSTLLLRREGSSSASPGPEEAGGRSKTASSQHSSVSQDAKAEMRSDGGLQLVPLRSPC